MNRFRYLLGEKPEAVYFLPVETGKELFYKRYLEDMQNAYRDLDSIYVRQNNGQELLRLADGTFREINE